MRQGRVEHLSTRPVTSAMRLVPVCHDRLSTVGPQNLHFLYISIVNLKIPGKIPTKREKRRGREGRESGEERALSGMAQQIETSKTSAATEVSASSPGDDGVEAAIDEDPNEPPLENLSKNARKRLIKLEQKESRKAKRKEEKKIRKQQRVERNASSSSGPAATAEGEQLPSRAIITDNMTHGEAAWATWKHLGSPRWVLAPMVNQSELPFRLLARRHGAGLCYTPMLHSTRFASEEQYRIENFDDHASDRPLVAQFCGDDPATLLAAAKHIQDRCDAVDINCGCPQGIARRGHYGAFLLDEPDLIVRLVSSLVQGLRLPVFLKMRVLPAADGSVDTEATIELARRIEAAGCSLLTVHGRTRVQKCSCECDWETIRQIRQALTIPVLANGGVERPEDLERCLLATGCAGVMTSEAALENPAMLSGQPTSRAGQAAVAREYMELARLHPPRGIAVLKAHFFKLLYMALEMHRDMRIALGAALTADGVYAVVDETCKREESAEGCIMSERCDHEAGPHTTWYRRHRGANAAPADRYGLPDAPKAAEEE
jgi:tRNA-dihydrouridine synthase 1